MDKKSFSTIVLILLTGAIAHAYIQEHNPAFLKNLPFFNQFQTDTLNQPEIPQTEIYIPDIPAEQPLAAPLPKIEEIKPEIKSNPQPEKRQILPRRNSGSCGPGGCPGGNCPPRVISGGCGSGSCGPMFRSGSCGPGGCGSSFRSSGCGSGGSGGCGSGSCGRGCR